MPGRALAIAAVVLLALLLWRSVFMVEENQVALISHFGQIRPGSYGPGAHLKMPLDELHRFDRRLVSRSYPGESFLSQDQKPLTVEFFLRWRLNDPQRFFEATGGDEDAVAARLAELVRGQIRAALGAGALTADISGAHTAADVLPLEPLRGPAEQLGVVLIDAQVQRIDLPDELANTIYQRMQEKLLAQAQQLRTQGSEQSERIRSDAEHKHAQVLADATREAQRIRGDADSAAAGIYARAYAANPEFAAFTRTLQAYKSSLGREGDILVITPEGEFFKYLHSANGR